YGCPINECPPIPPFSPDRLPWEVNIAGLIPSDPPIGSWDWRDNVLIGTASAVAGQVFNAGWGAIYLSPGMLPGDFRSDPVYGSLVPQGKADIFFSFFNYLFPGFQGLPGAYRGLPAIGVVMTEFFNDSINGCYGNTVPWQSQQAFGEIPVFP
ncbi:MAG TPA: hypothetical protein VLK23_17410, partial [Thermodesulfobacteriota bacterium]|nr:hypothetical protein [Thermodesulfobacteriota bacterium]